MTLPLPHLDDHQMLLAARLGAEPYLVVNTRRRCRLEGIRINVQGSDAVLQAARRHGTRLPVASSSEVSGKNTEVGLREDDDRIGGSPLTHRWSSFEAKALDESLLAASVEASACTG